MFGHEDLRAALRAHVLAQLPIHLAGVRDRRSVATPTDPIPAAIYLADTLNVATLYPAVLVRSVDLDGMTIIGDGLTSASRYRCEIAVAAEVSTSSAYEAASLDRDRLLEALRLTVLAPATSLAPEIQIARTTYSESAGPAAENLLGRPLAVGVASFVALVAEVAPDLSTGTEVIDAADLTVDARSASESL